MAKKLKIRGKDLEKIGFPRGSKAIGVAINVMLKNYRKNNKGFVLDLLRKIVENPAAYQEDKTLGKIAQELLVKIEPDVTHQEIPIQKASETKDYKIFGKQFIGEIAKEQMALAMRLPITVEGALMPDAHAGYGMPIGGVLAVENAVIPYGVGMDIGCRMCLSIYDLPAEFLEHNDYLLKQYVKENSRFGHKEFTDNQRDDAIFSRSEFKEIPFVKRLKDKAYKQIGSSGSGNHFVEFGIVEITDVDNEFNLAPKKYVGLLTHSGSRGLGANIAQYYTKIAKQKCHLPKGAQHLAWLMLNSQEGMEYWLAMNLAGDYASACHHHIHHRMSKSLSEQPVAVVENHHNFAWKEQLSNGQEVIVHRKGATPAGKGVLGVIPGSMTTPGFIVRGKGSPLSINSASHGAGRAMSRTKAKNSFTGKDMRQNLKKHRVSLIGGGLDEIAMAYKDIHKVMAAQQDLVEIVGTFMPKIVRMDKG